MDGWKTSFLLVSGRVLQKEPNKHRKHHKPIGSWQNGGGIVSYLTKSTGKKKSILLHVILDNNAYQYGCLSSKRPSDPKPKKHWILHFLELTGSSLHWIRFRDCKFNPSVRFVSQLDDSMTPFLPQDLGISWNIWIYSVSQAIRMIL